MGDIVFTGVAEFAKAIDAMITAANLAGKTFVTQGGHLIERNAKAHMNGRPGPNVVSGTLRRSVMVVEVVSVGIESWQSTTGPTVAYGRRIELGFHGTDSLGRRYNQPAFPFLKPGFDESMPGLTTLYETAVAAALKV